MHYDKRSIEFCIKINFPVNVDIMAPIPQELGFHFYISVLDICGLVPVPGRYLGHLIKEF
ncbi:Uncharacterised protein [uncultured archaeon]|nr:Uncharacterised protein [uncultured archaeon]